MVFTSVQTCDACVEQVINDYAAAAGVAAEVMLDAARRLSGEVPNQPTVEELPARGLCKFLSAGDSRLPAG